MFGFFRRKKQTTALDQIIAAAYGANPPPPQRANLDEAIQIAYEQLLAEQIEKGQVAAVARGLFESPVPYSTHDLALSAAYHFLKQPENRQRLADAQFLFRTAAVLWLTEKWVAPMLVESYEEMLYKIYKA